MALSQLTSVRRRHQGFFGRKTARDLGLPEGSHIPAIYIHVPFCRHKCHYCDFYSVVDAHDRREPFARRLAEEMRHAARWAPGPVESVFIGGGTPTLLEPDHWRDLLAVAAELWRGSETSEWTMEANPETVTRPLAQALAAGGINRMSIGCQSFDPAHLLALERIHDPASAGRSVDILRDAGITNLNLDLIFGIPGQTIEDWQRDLETALDLEPSHLSCYGLTYEPNTPLAARLRRGQIVPVPDATAAAMYELAMDRLGEAGFAHYEISNWARPGRRCRHNLTYWSNGNWWPLGPAAAGHVDGVRWRNDAALQSYLDERPLSSIHAVERLDTDGRVGESFMLGLRLTEGIQRRRVESLLEAGARQSQRRQAIERHGDAGLLEWTDESLRLTRRGLMLADSVLVDLV